MENTAMMYQPRALVLKRKGNPEQLVRDWETYISGFKAFLLATKRISHSDPEMAGMPCDRCRVTKSLLTLAGGTEVAHCVTLGNVAETDSWEEALEKISRGIVSQTDQAK